MTWLTNTKTGYHIVTLDQNLTDIDELLIQWFHPVNSLWPIYVGLSNMFNGIRCGIQYIVGGFVKALFIFS